MSDWFYRSGDRICGPVSRQELEFLAASGRVRAATEVRSGQKGEWSRFGSKALQSAATNTNIKPAANETEFVSAIDTGSSISGPEMESDRTHTNAVVEESEGDSSKKQVVLGISLGVIALLAMLLLWTAVPEGGTSVASAANEASEGDEGTASGTSDRSTHVNSSAGQDESAADTASQDASQEDFEPDEDSTTSEVAGASAVNSQLQQNSSNASDGGSASTAAVGKAGMPAEQVDLNADNDTGRNAGVPGDPLSKFTISAPGEATFFGLEASGRRFAFVVDQSGSMAGSPLEQAKDELLRCLRHLPQHVEVLIVFFDDSAHPSPDGYSTLGHPRMQRLAKWVNNVVVGGGTNVKVGMEYALTQKWKPDAVFLLTDGECEPDTPRFIAQLNADQSIRINTVSLVSRLGEGLLKQIARENNGDYRHVP